MLVYQRVGISRRYLGLPRFHCFGPIMADLLPEKSVFKCSNHPLLKNYWCSRDPLHSPNVSSNQSVETGYQFNHCCSMLSSHKATCLLVRFPLLKCWVSKCNFKSQLLMLEPPLLLVESRFLTVTSDFVWLNSAFWSFCWNPWVLHVESPWIPLSAWMPISWPVNSMDIHHFCLCAHFVEVLAPPSGPSRPSGPSARESLIFSAFRALNRSGSGHLSAAEMRPFAEITGVANCGWWMLVGFGLVDNLRSFLKIWRLPKSPGFKMFQRMVKWLGWFGGTPMWLDGFFDGQADLEMDDLGYPPIYGKPLFRLDSGKLT